MRYKFKIHFTAGGEEDFVVVEGNSIDEIQNKAALALSSRGLNAETCNPWSQEISE